MTTALACGCHPAQPHRPNWERESPPTFSVTLAAGSNLPLSSWLRPATCQISTDDELAQPEEKEVTVVSFRGKLGGLKTEPAGE